MKEVSNSGGAKQMVLNYHMGALGQVRFLCLIVFCVLCLCPQCADIEAYMFCRFLSISKLREVVVFVSSKCIEIVLHL